MGERDRLTPADANPPNQVRQIYDPVLGAFRTASVPPNLSRASLPDALSSSRTYSKSVAPSLQNARDSRPSSRLRLEAQRLTDPKQPRVPLESSSRHVFQRLPTSVYDCIIHRLKIAHKVSLPNHCHTCYIRDLCSVAAVNRSFNKCVIKELYCRISITGHSSELQSKKQKSKIIHRLRLLRRTLRTRGCLAHFVEELHVPVSEAVNDPPSQELVNIVASVVMSCPNLEKLTGFHLLYAHRFDRLTHALSTRKRLLEHVWLIGENHDVAQRSFKQLSPGLMDAEQKTLFVGFHDMWPVLTTLILHSPEQGILEKDILVNKINVNDPQMVQGLGILHRLPSLRHLCISSFDMDDFDDSALQQLPALESLRLQDLEGVTFWGLSEFSRNREASSSIQRLALVNLDVLYMSAISSLLLRLKNLKKFTLVQETEPALPIGEVVMQPIIASSRLENLHWDVMMPGTANHNLASAIRAGGFPKLRRIRAPSDDDGTLQALCKPRAQILLPSDWSPKSSVLVRTSGLRAARRAAQQRMEDAWTTVKYKLVVEEAGKVKELFDFSGFMGSLDSMIEYSLDPDVAGSDKALIDFEDISFVTRTEQTCDSSCIKRTAPVSSSGEYVTRSQPGRIDFMKFF